MKRVLTAAAAAMSLVGCGGTTCIARGARVATPGGPRPIEALREGDTIVVVEPASGMTAASRIVRIVSSHREVGALALGGVSLRLTSDHPVYDPVARGFFPAGDWLLGTRTSLLRLDGDAVRPALVEQAQPFVGTAEVFDLTVEHEWHTFVAEGVVVHNKSVLLNCITDAGVVVAGTPCQCAIGTGRTTCDFAERLARCESCMQADGGMPDAGP